VGKTAETIDLVARPRCWKDVVWYRGLFCGPIFRVPNDFLRDSISMGHEKGAIGVDHFGDFGVPQPECVGQPLPIMAVEPVDELVQVCFVTGEVFPWSVVKKRGCSSMLGRHGFASVSMGMLGSNGSASALRGMLVVVGFVRLPSWLRRCGHSPVLVGTPAFSGLIILLRTQLSKTCCESLVLVDMLAVGGFALVSAS